MYNFIKKLFTRHKQDDLEGTIIALAREKYNGNNGYYRLITEIGIVRKTQECSWLVNKTVYCVDWRRLDDDTLSRSVTMNKDHMINWLSDTETYIHLGHGDEQKKLLALMLTKPEYFVSK